MVKLLEKTIALFLGAFFFLFSLIRFFWDGEVSATDGADDKVCTALISKSNYTKK